MAHLKMEDLAKLHSFLALKSFDNCAYISPYMLALKNCDDIFSIKSDGLIMAENDEKASTFLFKPSMDNYMTLTTYLRPCKLNGM